MAKKKFYVVWQGRKTGIFTDWNSCKAQVEAFSGARYKSYPTREEAEAAFAGNRAVSTSKATKKKVSPADIKTYSAAEIAAMPIDIKIFTDGACEPNPGKAGSGLAVYRDNVVSELWFGMYEPDGTNNTAELNGLHQALILAQSEIEQAKSVAIFCDSKYSIQCVTQWAVNWERKGWKKKGGEIKNLELIKELFALHQELKDKLDVFHVNGHVGVEGNELADRMSILAIDSRASDLRLYDGELDVSALLAMRTG